MTEDREQLIVSLWKDGQTYQQIAQRFGLSRSRVGQIINRALWREAENDDAIPFPGHIWVMFSRPLRAMLDAGYDTVSKILAATDAELLRFPYLGASGLARLRHDLQHWETWRNLSDEERARLIADNFAQELTFEGIRLSDQERASLIVATTESLRARRMGTRD